MSKKITNKTIEQTVPHLVPFIIAEIVAEKALHSIYQEKHADFSKWDYATRLAANEEYKAELNKLINYFLDRAETAFQYNEQFHKNVISKKNEGNHGRDYLYMFMYHWAGLDDNGNLRAGQTKPNYQQGIDNWEKGKELYKKNLETLTDAKSNGE